LPDMAFVGFSSSSLYQQVAKHVPNVTSITAKIRVLDQMSEQITVDFQAEA